jgi:uncharacterized protein involved in exopolysaccharide biosynthesis
MCVVLVAAAFHVNAQAPQPNPPVSTASPFVQSAMTSQIAAIETRLIELRETYSENHPEVRRLEAQLGALRQAQDNDKK